MVYTFIIPPLAAISSTVTWVLEAVNEGTKLMLTHEGLGELGDEALDLMIALDDGLDKHLASLRKVIVD